MRALIIAASLAAAPLQGAGSAAPPRSPPASQTYHALAEIAGEICSAPPSSGWFLGTSGAGSLSLSPARLIARLAALGVKVGGSASYQRWQGPLQKDIGPALAARSTCQQAVFVAMVSKLPLVDGKTGRTVARPSRPVQLYHDIAATAPARPATPPPVAVNTNSGQQITATGTSTNYATGGPVSSGSGAAIQNNYFGAPVTADQKQQARDALLLNLRELAAYPERGTVEPGPALVQHLFRLHAPRALYVLLSKYDRETIAAMPNGATLNDYERQYYNFEQQSLAFEPQMMSHIGGLVKTKISEAWQLYYGYAIRRLNGYPAAQLIANDGMLNFDMTPEDEERVFLLLRDDPKFGPALAQVAGAINAFTQAVDQVLKPYNY